MVNPVGKKRIRKIVKRFLGLFATVVVIYLLLVIYPNPLFAYKYNYKNFSVHSDKPIHANIEFVLDNVLKRLEKSELYEASDKFKIFICNDNWRLKLFTRNGIVGGMLNFPVSPNVFIRESNILKNKIVPYSEPMPAPEARSLSYFIAHEATHCLQRKISPFLIFYTPLYIIEGYADYIAKQPDFNYKKYRKLYLDNDFVMNPKNGLYNKYHLYIAYLMEKEKYSFAAILDEQPEINSVMQKVAEN